MLQTSVVQVSGRGTNVDFAIDDTSPFDQVVSGLRKYLEDNRGLWSKGNITVNAGLRMGSREQLTELKRLIEKESGLTVARFWCSSDTVDPASTRAPSSQNRGPVRVQPPTRPLPETPVQQVNNTAPAKTITPVSVVDIPVDTPAETTPPSPAAAVASGAAVKSAPSPKPNRKPRLEPRTATAAGSVDVLEDKASENKLPAPHVSGPEPRRARSTLPEPARRTAEFEIDTPGFDQQIDNQADYGEYMESRRDTALFVKSTCRSGEIIRHSGDVVVLGDVNPGAEIVAGGDITVFGALRGVAHAGPNGLTKAAIIAYRLESPRLQIGPYIGLTSNPKPGGGKNPKSGGSGPMIAFVRRRSIYVAEFAGRFARYSRGILYEG